MAYKTCEDCGSRIFEHGCVNCNEQDYIDMQGAYDTREEVKVISSKPVLGDVARYEGVCRNEKCVWNVSRTCKCRDINGSCSCYIA